MTDRRVFFQPAAERARKCEELPAATEALPAPIARPVEEGRLVGADTIGLAVGEVVNRYKMVKHLTLSLAGGSFS